MPTGGEHDRSAFRLIDKVTGIYLYNMNEKTASDTTLQRYKLLKQRAEMEFGADNVSD